MCCSKVVLKYILFEMFLENQKEFSNEQGHADQFSLIVSIILLMSFLSN